VIYATDEGDESDRNAPKPIAAMRIVMDTSVLIRYLIKPSAAIRELIEVWWLGDRVQMITAPELIEELEQVLSRQGIRAFIRPPEGQILLETIRLKGETLAALGTLPSYCRDPKDDKFVACALVGAASFVVTADEDLLILDEVSGVRMMTPYHFVALLKRLNP